MSIFSMTGFARQNGDFHFEKTDFSWFWEIKSVNNKATDIKFRIPSWLDNSLSLACKNIITKNFARGSFSVCLDLTSTAASQQVRINEELLSALTNQALALYAQNPNKLQKPSASELLSMKGVCELEDASLDEEEISQLAQVLLQSFEQTCLKLKDDRMAEGEKIRTALLDILQNIEKIVFKIDDFAKTLPQLMKTRLQEQIASLLEPSNQVSEDRLAQEVALYVAKADIQEEVDRLKAHIKTAKNLLSLSEPVGRRLDFLCQELNREANTTCSKSCDIELTNCGMDLKTLIEQFREQVQNIE